MILVDTNVIIDFWDKPTEEAKSVFEENEIATCGVIKQNCCEEATLTNNLLRWK